MHIHIRDLKPDDIDCVRDITLQAWMQTYSRFIPRQDLLAYYNEHYSREALERLFSSPDVHGFAGMADGRCAGYVKTRFDGNEKRFYITSLYVLPAYQAKGIGTALFKKVLEWAATFPVNEVWIGVMNENTEALAWYTKLGFIFIREEPFTMAASTVAHRIGCKKLST